MGKTIWRYTLTAQEQKLWDTEGMEGWREAMEACVEDDARDEGFKKYVVYDRGGSVLAKNEVRKLPEPEPVDN